MAGKLSDLPNIGKELEKKLKQAGINTPEQLKITGSRNAFIKLKTIYNGACINMFYALEGAIQEIRWHSLDKKTKEELKEFYNMIK